MSEPEMCVCGHGFLSHRAAFMDTVAQESGKCWQVDKPCYLPALHPETAATGDAAQRGQEGRVAVMAMDPPGQVQRMERQMIRATPPRGAPLREWVCAYCDAHGPADSEENQRDLTRRHLKVCALALDEAMRFARAMAMFTGPR